MTVRTFTDQNGETRLVASIDPEPTFNGGTITNPLTIDTPGPLAPGVRPLKVLVPDGINAERFSVESQTGNEVTAVLAGGTLYTSPTVGQLALEVADSSGNDILTVGDTGIVTVTGQTVMSEANPATPPLQLKPTTGATAAATDQIEIYDDAGNLLGYWDAAGDLSTIGTFSCTQAVGTASALTTSDGTMCWIATDGHAGIGTGHAAPATATLSSGTGHRFDTFVDVRTYTPVTFNPSGIATATCAVAVSPDNVTYTTLWTETEPVGVVFDGTIHGIDVFVPRLWYLRLTVVNATIGTTTYY